MHYLDESHILLFLVQLFALLAFARTFGVVCRKLDVPPLAGELLVGVVLGPTILGRVAPSVQVALFPPDPVQFTMLDTVAWLGVFFLLLSVGFEVRVPRGARAPAAAAASVGIIGVLVPVAIGVLAFWQLDPAYWGPETTQMGFAVFLAVAGSITAISVVARLVRDLDLMGTRIGVLILSACAVNDVFGWVLFTFALGFATGEGVGFTRGGLAFAGASIFTVLCLTVGVRLLARAARWVRGTGLKEVPALLSLVTSTGLICGITTHLLGIHAVLGFFLAGVMVGSLDGGIEAEQRESLSNTMHALFVPIFFATIGIKIDFLEQVDVSLTLAFFSVAVGGKFIGALIGAWLGRVATPRAVLIAIAFIPGGAMEIVVGLLALEVGLIARPTFVAIVFAAIVSSIAVGPLFAWWSRRAADALTDPEPPEVVGAAGAAGAEAS